MPYFPPVLLRSGALAGATVQAQEFSNALIPLQARRTNLGANAFYVGLDVISQKLTDMADGFGSSVAFYIRDNAGIDNPIGQIGFIRAGADNTGSYLVYVVQGGSSIQISEWTPSQFTLGGTSNLDRKILLPSGSGGANVSTFQFGTTSRDWSMAAGASPYSWTLNYVGTDAARAGIITALKGGNLGFGVGTPTAVLHPSASTTARASLCLPHGAAPTSPVNGDMWTTTAGLYVQINGSTVGPLS